MRSRPARLGYASVSVVRGTDRFAVGYVSHQQGALQGLAAAFFEDQTPSLIASYSKGKRQGILKTWNPEGQRVYWCEYSQGKRNGFCCLFRDDQLLLLSECANDAFGDLHLISAGKVQRTFRGPEQAAGDETAKDALARLDEVESDIQASERILRQKAQAEERLDKQKAREAARKSEQAERQQRVAELNPQRRQAMQARTNARATERQSLINGLRARSGL